MTLLRMNSLPMFLRQSSPGGDIKPYLGTIILNDFVNTVKYMHGLRTGTGAR